MKIRDLLAAESIELNGKVTGKKETLDAMVDLMAKSGKINDVEVYRKGVYAREEESTTGIGEGIAIPHCKSDSVSRPGLAAMVVPEGVDFDSLDGEKVNLIFLIAAPNTKENVHLDVLSKLSVLLMDEDFTANLRNAKTIDEFLHVIDAAEAEKDAEEEKKEEEKKAEAPASNGKLILAVTGCPTGIAHTYMAAEALEKKAKELGYRIKVETRGSGGAKNVLTKAEIAEAECIIVAADTQVPMDRFAGKPVIQCKVADGISKAEELLTKAANGHASIYEAGGKAADDEEEGKDSLGHQIYKHLMNGVSHMLPFVVGGGILIAIAFLIGGWFFIRNAVIHDGDLLGMRTSKESASLYATEEYKPENRQTPASEGWSFQQTYLQTPEGRTSNWLFSTVSSFIGSFSYMTVHLPMVLYLLYGALMAFGFLVFLFLGMVPHWFRKKPQLLLFVMLFLACLITLFMDMYNTYFSDYQSQGRYLMPALIPLMVWIGDGYSSLTAKLPQEWKRAACHLTLLPGAVWLVLFLISYVGFLIPGCCA